MQHITDRLHDAKIPDSIRRMPIKGSEGTVMLPTKHGVCKATKKVLNLIGNQCEKK